MGIIKPEGRLSVRTDSGRVIVEIVYQLPSVRGRVPTNQSQIDLHFAYSAYKSRIPGLNYYSR